MGAVFAALGVLAGAFGAHALSPHLDARALGWYRTAGEYLIWHALALVAVGLWVQTHAAGRAARVAAVAFVAGIVLFSGSLYALALGAPRAVAMLTPVGGLAFIVGWSAFAVGAWRRT